MGKLIRCITEEGCVVVSCVDSTEPVEVMRQIHNSSKVCTAALGRLLTGSALAAAMLKNDNSSVTLRVNGGGPIGSLIAVAERDGGVRAYMMDAHVELPLNEKGKLDVGKAVGSKGLLNVLKYVGLSEPSMGQVPLVSGEIAEDLTSYYAESEQIPTVCALGVLVNPDLSVARAGGFMIQLLPTADNEIISMVERGLKGLPGVTELMEQGLTPMDICKRVLPEFQVQMLDEREVTYRCNCSRERVERALISTGKQSLTELLEDEKTEVKCHFCPKVYTFTPEDIQKLLSECSE